MNFVNVLGKQRASEDLSSQIVRRGACHYRTLYVKKCNATRTCVSGCLSVYSFAIFILIEKQDDLTMNLLTDNREKGNGMPEIHTSTVKNTDTRACKGSSVRIFKL